MAIEQKWKKYAQETMFNFFILPEYIQQKGKEMTFQQKQFIVFRGDPLQYVYFIKSGSALGTRNYADGNEYNYFMIDSKNGSIGLLELFAREAEYIASILCITEVRTIRIDAEIIYDYVMGNQEMLRRCITLIAQDLYKRSANDGRFYYLDGINRVRHYFVDYYNEHLKENRKKITVYTEYRDIAASVGISVRTVGRSIRQLKDNGEIQSKDKKVVIDENNYKLLLSSMTL
ncbi:Crp/Fnr family transcriptional regulator [Schaedlerella arabinosiphila]|uniref:Crp/Fnr family transcriptional regulator n=1 Tax=Schaedlerella arabinosiphila TaxID=2044587 RepID=A0A9X5C7I7_9FIRM|nr:Crp/Fnr family transcriptional regulator [Schaedlerella arabinosiphila]KAI4441375.1 hypothetical protein C824_003874 [Schaedlerella arabinosiphila]NDO69181.1 Crp/Fnr family transcriptional regulator [Schaedlerella arabinosiphila]